MKRVVVLLYFLITLGVLHAQNLSGVWFAGNNLRIDKSAGVEEYKVDSIYGVEASILDFVSKEEFIIKGVGGKKFQGKYEKSRDTLNFQLDGYQWCGVFEDENLKLILIDSSDYQFEMFYKKLGPSKIAQENMLDSTEVLNSFWSLKLSTGHVGLSLLARDSTDIFNQNSLVASEFLNHRVHTEKGNYLIDSYNNYMFLYLLGRETIYENVLLLNDYSNNAYCGSLFVSDNMWVGFDSVELIELTEVSVLTELERANLESEIIGRYQLKLLDFHQMPHIENIKTVISYFELQDQNNCKIEAYITENKEGVSVIRKIDKLGTWELNPSGQYVTVSFNDGRTSYLTFNMGEDNEEFYLDKNPWIDEPSLNTVLKFKKQ